MHMKLDFCSSMDLCDADDADDAVFPIDLDGSRFCVVKSNSLLSGLRSEVKIIGVHSEYSVDQGHSCTKPNMEMSRLIKCCIQQWFVKSNIHIVNQVTFWN